MSLPIAQFLGGSQSLPQTVVVVFLLLGARGVAVFHQSRQIPTVRTSSSVLILVLILVLDSCGLFRSYVSNKNVCFPIGESCVPDPKWSNVCSIKK